ncbi:MAG: response regulator [Planctomycetota bacterium]|nr:response regulator [Planctomycetota bacterium]
MLLDKEVLTTGEVAKICNVAPRTVSKWFDSGALPGYRIPGSRDRRIPRPALIKFMKEHNIPLDGMSSGRTRVLLADDDKDVVETLRRILTEQTNYEVHVATSGFAAGLECERFKPHVILLDIHIGEADVKQLVDLVRKHDGLSYTKIIAMSGKLTDGQAQAIRAGNGATFDGFLKKPFQVRQVVDAIEAATNLVA